MGLENINSAFIKENMVFDFDFIPKIIYKINTPDLSYIDSESDMLSTTFKSS